MRIVGIPDGAVGNVDRALWMTPPFDIRTGGAVPADQTFRRAGDSTELYRRTPDSTQTFTRPAESTESYRRT